MDKESSSVNGTGTFGRNASDTWKPWDYSQRVRVAAAVEKFKRKIAKKRVSSSTK